MATGIGAGRHMRKDCSLYAWGGDGEILPFVESYPKKQLGTTLPHHSSFTDSLYPRPEKVHSPSPAPSQVSPFRLPPPSGTHRCDLSANLTAMPCGTDSPGSAATGSKRDSSSHPKPLPSPLSQRLPPRPQPQLTGEEARPPRGLRRPASPAG